MPAKAKNLEKLRSLAVFKGDHSTGQAGESRRGDAQIRVRSLVVFKGDRTTTTTEEKVEEAIALQVGIALENREIFLSFKGNAHPTTTT